MHETLFAVGGEAKQCNPAVRRRCLALDETCLLGARDELRHGRLRKLQPLRELCHRGLLRPVRRALDHEQQQVSLRRQSRGPRDSLASVQEPPQRGTEFSDVDDIVDRERIRAHGGIVGRYPARDENRATRPGTSACASNATRYQRGTNVSRRLWSMTCRTWRATSSGSITSRRSSRLARTLRCGKPSVSTKPGLTVWTRIPRPRNSAVRARENASCACLDAE